VGLGLYAGLEGNPRNGLKVVAVHNPYIWSIRPDELNNTALKFCSLGTNYALVLNCGSEKRVAGAPIEVWDESQGKFQFWKIELG
jgi:hypothetical protein